MLQLSNAVLVEPMPCILLVWEPIENFWRESRSPKSYKYWVDLTRGLSLRCALRQVTMSPAHHISPEKKVQALRLRDEGLSKSEIVRKTGMSRSTLAVLFRRAKKLNINGETSASGADVASVFPAELFLESAGQPRIKMNEYMTHQVWKQMEEDENVSARYLLEALPCLAGVSHRKVQQVMTNLRKNKKNGQ